MTEKNKDLNKHNSEEDLKPNESIEESFSKDSEYSLSTFCDELCEIKEGQRKTKKYITVKILDCVERTSQNKNNYLQLKISDGRRAKLCKLFTVESSQIFLNTFYKINLTGIKKSFFKEVLFMDPTFEEVSEQQVGHIEYNQEYDLEDKKAYCETIIPLKILQVVKLENFKPKMDPTPFTLDQKDLSIGSVLEEPLNYQEPIVIFLKDLEQRSYRVNLWPDVAKNHNLDLSSWVEGQTMINLKDGLYTRGPSVKDQIYGGFNLFSQIEVL